MARRGPKPKTAQVCRPKKGQTGAASVPAHLTGAAREEYARVALRLRDVGALAKHDSRLIEAYAEAHALRLKAWAQLESDGITVKTEGGRAMAHPAFALWRESATRQKILSVALGLGGGEQIVEAGDGEGAWGDLLSITG